MPSGITHMLLSRAVRDNISAEKGGAILALLCREQGAYLLGSVAPDLPYLSVADSQLFANQTEIADDLHYIHTNSVPLKGLLQAKHQAESTNIKLAEALYAFYLGYCSHFMADGLIHPYVRDKVGNYDVAKKEHRILEMNLDVFVAREFMGTDVNGIDFQDDLDWIEDCSFKTDIFESYSGLLNSIYGSSLNSEHVQRWFSAMQRVFSLAEGEFPRWYRELLSDSGIVFKNYEDLKSEAASYLTLQKPIDSEQYGLSSNFLGKENVHFFDDVTKGFFDRFPQIIIISYVAVFERGDGISNLLPEINFDTGRLVADNRLSEKPILWG
jgi:hypothetical protein